MEIRNCSRAEIETALQTVNAEFDGNVGFKKFEELNRKRTEAYRVTLTVRDSHGTGARTSADGSRAIAAACWHVHGTFIDALPEQAEIITSTRSERTIKRPGDRWEDWNIGSVYNPCMYSEACRCNE